MDERQQEIWDRIRAFELDDPNAATPFSARLASEQNWTPEFTERAISEYRKFTLLAVVAGHPVSPPPLVDAVWHLHLTYTQNYWERFCPDALGMTLHHHPTSGGPDEDEKFRAMYDQTRKSYARLFGHAPPQDIWPDLRADATLPGMLVHQRPEPLPWLWPALAATLLCAAFGCARLIGNLNPMELHGPAFLVFYALFAGGLFAFAWWLRHANRNPSQVDEESTAGISIAETGFLSGGKRQAVDAVVTALATRRVVEYIPAAGLIQRTHRPCVNDDPFEQSLLKVLGKGSRSVQDLPDFLGEEFKRLEESLQSRGLWVAGRAWVPMCLVPFGVALVAPALGIIKIALGLNQARPVIFLIFASLATIVAACVLFLPFPVRSKAGDRFLESKRMSLPARGASSSESLPWAVALIGSAALLGTPWAPLSQALHPAAGNPISAEVPVGGGCGGGDGGGGVSTGGGGCSG